MRSVPVGESSLVARIDVEGHFLGQDGDERSGLARQLVGQLLIVRLAHHHAPVVKAGLGLGVFRRAEERAEGGELLALRQHVIGLLDRRGEIARPLRRRHGEIAFEVIQYQAIRPHPLTVRLAVGQRLGLRDLFAQLRHQFRRVHIRQNAVLVAEQGGAFDGLFEGVPEGARPVWPPGRTSA